MTCSDATELLQLAEIDPAYYHVDEIGDEGVCLINEDGAWKVFIAERGSRWEEQSFQGEDEASVFFLKRVFRAYRWSSTR